MSTKNHFIFDFGANSGQNIEYYLARSDKVIAVEANPLLCNTIKANFLSEIQTEKLVIENFVLTNNLSLSGQLVDFFVHKEFSVLSQFQKPEVLDDFKKISVPSISASELIKKYTLKNEEILYVKIDLEGFDYQILKDLFINEIYPENISAESHSIDVFAALVATGVYKSFTLIEGRKVPEYRWLAGENQQINFEFHSAGPFGKDIAEPWYTSEAFFELLAYKGLGWKDIHASKKTNSRIEFLRGRHILKLIIPSVLSRMYRETIPYSVRKFIYKSRRVVKSLIFR